MKTSSEERVRELYEESADSYNKMMDAEIDLPIYSNILGRLAERIAELTGALIDTSCGPGHMLAKYHNDYDPGRPLLGIDLSPRMVTIAASNLGSKAEVSIGDMRDLRRIKSRSAAAVLSFFAIHHLGPEENAAALQEWHRVLMPGGQLVVAAWEGNGIIDYGATSDVVAFRYSQGQIAGWARAVGFTTDRCAVETVEEMPMDAVYLEGTKT